MFEIETIMIFVLLNIILQYDTKLHYSFFNNTALQLTNINFIV